MSKGVILEKPSEKLYFVRRRGMKYDPDREGELRKIRKEVREIDDHKTIKKKVKRTTYKQRGLSKIVEERKAIAEQRGDTFPALENLEQLKERALIPQEKEKLKEKRDKEKEDAELIRQGQLALPQQNLNLRALIAGLPQKIQTAIVAGLPAMAPAGVGAPTMLPPVASAPFTPSASMAKMATAKSAEQVYWFNVGKTFTTRPTKPTLKPYVDSVYKTVTDNRLHYAEQGFDFAHIPSIRPVSPVSSMGSMHSATSAPSSPTSKRKPPVVTGKGLSLMGSNPSTWTPTGGGFFKDLFNKAKDAVLSDPVGTIKKAYEIGKKGVDIGKKLKGVDIRNNPIGALNVLSGIGGALPKAHRQRFHDNCRGEFDRIHGAGFFDKLKEGLGGIAAPFRLASKINPMFGFGVDKIADAVGVPTISSTLGAGLDLEHGGGILDSLKGLTNAPSQFRQSIKDNPNGASALFGTLFKHFMAGGDLKMARKVKRHFKKEIDAVHGAGFFSSLLKKAVKAGVNKVVEKVKSDPIGSLKQAIDVGKQGIDILGKGGSLSSTISVV